MVRGVGITVLLFSLIALNALGDSLSLTNAVQEAKVQSPVIARLQAVKEENSYKHLEALSGHIPSLSLGANRLLSKKFMFIDLAFTPGSTPVSFPTIIPTTTYSLGVNWNLFDGFATINRIQAASQMENASEIELGAALFGLERETSLRFFHALAAEILVQVSEHNVATLEDHLKDVRYFKQAGSSTQYDVLKVEVQASEARTELINAKSQRELDKLKLAEAMGKERDDRTLSGTLPELAATDVQKVLAQELKPMARKDILAQGMKVEALANQEAAASAHWAPKLNAFANYQYYNNRTNTVWDTNDFRGAYQVGLGLTWDLFDGLKSYARDGQATALRLQAEATLREKQLKAVQDMNFWRSRLTYFSALFDAKKNEVDKARESMRLAREGRNAGIRTNTDLLDAELDLFKAEAGKVNAQVGALESLLQLELSTGTSLHSFL